jgi:hypothetical protein
VKKEHVKYGNIIITMVIYWLLLSVNMLITKVLNLSSLTEWWMNTVVLMILVVICLATLRTCLKILYKLTLIPIVWIVHAILTIPSSFVLGIIMNDPDHIRTNGEHRAVFILSSLPIIFMLMQKSKLFITNIEVNNRDIKT